MASSPTARPRSGGRSTEHNIDAYALFTILARLTRDRRWSHRADVAGAFVNRMWNRQGGFFWTGTLGGLPGEDPNLINKGNIPEDVQTWAMLSLRERRYDRAADWVVRKLSNTDTAGPGSQLPAGVTVSGVTFSDQAKALTGTVSGGDVPNNRNAVWLEGNAHLAAALLYRDDHGDRTQAETAAQAGRRRPAEDRRRADRRPDRRPERRQAVQPGRGRHLHRHGPARRVRHRRDDECLRHRFRVQLLPAPARRRDVVVPHGGARRQPVPLIGPYR